MAVDRLVWKVILDAAILICMGVILLVLEVWAPPYERGYFLDDQSIRLPYKPSLISTLLLTVLGAILLIAVIIFTEMFRDKRGKGIGEKYVFKTRIPGWVWESYTGIGVCTFGAFCQQIIVDVGKLSIGRLRPHFFDLCNPTPIGTVQEYQYITNYTCVEARPSLLREMRLSFPSGHSSFAMYTAVFLILYIHTKYKWRGSKLLLHGLKFTMFIAAWFVGLSRVKDHQHHWSDVAAGFVVGAACAVFVFFYVLKPKKYGLPGSWSGPQTENALPRPAVAR